MAASPPPSLVYIIQVVGPNILAFLSAKDILCSLQYASYDIRRFCVTTSQVWRDFINKYFLGSTLQQKPGLNLKTLRLISIHPSKLIPLEEIPGDVLYSMITGIIPAKDIKDIQGNSGYKYNKTDLKYRRSPFGQVKCSNIFKGYTVAIQLQLYWSGQWGIF